MRAKARLDGKQNAKTLNLLRRGMDGSVVLCRTCLLGEGALTAGSSPVVLAEQSTADASTPGQGECKGELGTER